MPDKHAHNKPAVSAELIRQYLAGELDDKAMHALERQALDDPFLAAALEGYALHAPAQQVHQEDLAARLSRRVAQEGRTAVVRPLYPRIAAAAAILLLLFTGGWFLFKTQNDKAPEIAQADRPVVIPEDTAAGVPADKPEMAMRPSGDSDNKKAAPIRQKEAPALARTMEPVADISAKDERLVEKPLERRELKQSPPNATFAAPVPPPAAAPALAQAAPVITPAPAPVSIDRQQNDIAADRRDSGAMGYNNRALEEVVTTGFGAARARKAASVPHDSLTRNIPRDEQMAYALEGKVAGVSVDSETRRKGNKGRKPDTQPVPVSGRVAYEQYLLEHTANPGAFNGVVRIAFTVMPDSTLQDIKVVQSLNAACDAEAVRVVKEGPAWKPAADRKPANVTLEVIFRKKADQ
ncbi:TonB protein C-terminal [Chitinophaga eiseniae]|uniref:TonB protein C-terminal n=1 Tax=Chitinophaga eiseniae TaxID=634771 RepID=A0A1T4RRX6_9BACT|nr:energy transducer TonB [Chitinophaga eiseniae]SKA18401.1 TonB protein C-terminal [Chitinophaga eiseniae]